MERIDFFVGKKSKKKEELFKKLGFDRVIYVTEIKGLNFFSNPKKGEACLIVSDNLESLRRLIDKSSNFFNYILVLGTNDEINREALQHRKVFALVAPEYNRKEDALSQRNSGLNHVLCRIAFNNNKLIVFRYSDLLNKDVKEKSILLGRLSQNLLLCRKYKVNYSLLNFSSSTKNLLDYSKLKTFERVLSGKN